MKQYAVEFEYYRELHRNRNRIAEFVAENDSTDFRRKAWDLDKWKFIPSVQRALQHKPDAKWLMFIECDSYLIWSNLLHWIAQLDSTKPYFLGLPVTMHEQLFAYGGAGWLLSRAAAEQMARHVASQADGYESFTNGAGYGDLVLGHVLERAGVPLTGAWPVIQRETPSTMEYTVDVMCHPVVTFHHIEKAEISAIWDLEQEWIASGGETEAGPQTLPPLLHVDIFTRVVYPHLTTRMDDWDNFSDGEEKTLAHSEGFDKCKRYCEEDERCVQFRVTSTAKTRKCTLSNSVTLGWQAAGDGVSLDQERSVSGWMMERIDQIKRSVRCNGANWPTSII
ncbi:hypothetical protein BJY01DRAFT_240775 [Aspergillus pseudoustus]|uniref:N-acetylgalactosaminide beta-1,3-galactosyltransferase n=1 Tax=Aspergillus pseudoustus TaxID=1810923 RepID=A0ABR4IMP2_9EURO